MVGPDALEPLLGRILEERAITAVLDVGANRGDFARLLRSAAVGYDGRILSFEPQADVFAALAAAAADDPRWETYPFALGAEDAERTIHRFEASELASLWAMNDDGRAFLPLGSPARGVAPVAVRTLAGLWAQLGLDGEAVLLKADTQGFELEVLRGAGDRLAGVQALLLEVAVTPLYEGTPDWRTVVDAVTAAGFVPSGFFLVKRAPDLRAIELDFVAVRHPA